MFSGTLSALVTPFKESKERFEPEVDYDSLEKLVHWQLESRVNGFVMCATTGEGPTLTDEEKIQILKRTIELVKGRVPVIAGTGTNNTKKSIEFTQEAKRLKADAALVVSPYYNKPNQEGLFQHFQAVAKHGGLPVIVYDIPSRSGVEVSVQTFIRLTEVPGIIGVKEATDSISKINELSAAVGKKLCLLAGDCGITYSLMAVGGTGVISASASAIPQEMVAITDNMLAGKTEAARHAQFLANPMISALFSETNPVPAKTALKMMGRIQSDAVRLPLVPVRKETRELLQKALNIS